MSEIHRNRPEDMIVYCRECKRIIAPEEDIDDGKCNDCIKKVKEHFNDVIVLTKHEEPQ